MDRREFCVSGAVAVAGTMAAHAQPTPVPAWRSGSAPPDALYKVIFDVRFAASQAFGLAAASVGRVTTGIRGDVTSLWLNDLQRQWALSRAGIAGMTTMHSFFCLQQLAKDHWMRAIVCAEHRQQGAAADAQRVARIVGIQAAGRAPTLDPQLVSWVIAA